MKVNLLKVNFANSSEKIHKNNRLFFSSAILQGFSTLVKYLFCVGLSKQTKFLRTGDCLQ